MRSGRGITRAGGGVLLVLGAVAFFGGGALFAFASVDSGLVRLFVVVSLAGLLTALLGLKNVVLPSARKRKQGPT